MNGFFLALVAALLTGMGSRDQYLVARLAIASGRRWPLLIIAIAVVSLAAAIAARAGREIAARVSQQTLPLIMAGALVIAGFGLLSIIHERRLTEPTNSLGAAAIVLLAYQIADSGGWLIFAIALAGSASPAAWGGALGGGCTVALGWFGGERCRRVTPRLRQARRCGGVILLVTAVAMIAFYNHRPCLFSLGRLEQPW